MIPTNEKMNNGKTAPVLTPLHGSCRLCQYSGFSTVCNFAQGGRCHYLSIKNKLPSEAATSVLS